MYTYNFPMVALTADIVVFRQGSFKDVEVLLIQRNNDPYKGFLALPGGYVNSEYEEIKEAAKRELKEETGIEIADMRFSHYYDSPTRDSRGRVVSFAFYTVVPYNTVANAGDDASNAVWVSVKELKALGHALAFDHWNIIEDAYRTLCRTYVE